MATKKKEPKKEVDRIYTLEINETHSLDDYTQVRRVHGGWLYIFWDVEHSMKGAYRKHVTHSVFVPLKEEFDKLPK